MRTDRPVITKCLRRVLGHKKAVSKCRKRASQTLPRRKCDTEESNTIAFAFSVYNIYFADSLQVSVLLHTCVNHSLQTPFMIASVVQWS